MGFWQHLADSYDKNSDALKSTYPLSTTSISNHGDIIAVIVIDGKGKFVRSEKIEKVKQDKKTGEYIIPPASITIPVTEESMGRSSGISPHPVFDQFEYLKGIVGKDDEWINRFYDHCEHVREHIKRLKANDKKTESNFKRWKDYAARIKDLKDSGKKCDAYVAQLKRFADSSFATEQVRAIYRYVARRTVASDLKGMNLEDKTNVVFQVEIPGNPQTKVWEDDSLFHAWHQYYLSEKKKAEENGMQSLDYITGTEQPMATFHPKKISNARGTANAKLISDNDKTNYTFRGKFSESSEAVSIGYETSQKVHQFLRYLISDRGRSYYCGEQVILSFTIGSTEKMLPPPIEDKSIWVFLQEAQANTAVDKQIGLRAETGFDYAEALKQSLAGFGYGKALEQHATTAVIALDAATTGRLSVTFYRELDRTEYLDKIADWHSGCKWNQQFWDKKNEKVVPYIGAPSVDKIIEAVHGKPRSRNDESYTKIKKGARERLLRCIFDGAYLPRDYVTGAVRRASNPMGITGKFDRSSFEQVVSTACALVRKHYQQETTEEYKLSIELDRTDRDYLYGRLLGAADKLEEYALYKKDKDRVVTAAIRHMQTFAQRPFRAWQTIHSCLNPYIQAVKGGFAFNEIQAVMDKFAKGDYEKEAPLNGSYLIGYYHERAHIDSLVKDAWMKKQSNNSNEGEDNNDGQ